MGDTVSEDENIKMLPLAIEFLNGHVIDFSSCKGDSAKIIDLANRTAYELAIDEYSESHYFPISFCGDDDCEDCDGWDGTSRRCECGNRRVYWESEGNFIDYINGKYYISAQAY
jgi:hypothetical protein